MSPTEKIVAAGASFGPGAGEVRDGLGRRLLLRRLNALDRLRLFKAVGPALSENAAYLGMAMLAVSVAAVDDVPLPMPASEAQLEALVSRLGDEGLEAVAATMPDQQVDPDRLALQAGN